MTLNEYQQRAMTTCTLSSENFSYMFLNLVGEVGEFASKVAKAIRKGDAFIGEDTDLVEDWTFTNDLTLCGETTKDINELETALKKEAGDILWQLSGLCDNMGWTLEEVAQLNLDKLAARKQAGTIVGNGDGISGAERTK